MSTAEEKFDDLGPIAGELNAIKDQMDHLKDFKNEVLPGFPDTFFYFYVIFNDLVWTVMLFVKQVFSKTTFLTFSFVAALVFNAF